MSLDLTYVYVRHDVIGACGQLALVLPGKDKDRATSVGVDDAPLAGTYTGVGVRGTSTVLRDVEDVVSSSSSSSSSSYGGVGKASKRPVAISTRNHLDRETTSTTSTSTTTTNTSTTSNSSSSENNNHEGQQGQQGREEEAVNEDPNSPTSRRNKLAGVDLNWPTITTGVMAVVGVTALVGVVVLSRKATLR